MIAIASTTPPDVLVDHVWGTTNADGFAAMAVTEVLVHGYDISHGTAAVWTPDSTMCRRVLTRLFPDVPPSSSVDPWHTLLWATGRQELDKVGIRSDWRWYV